jgi:hypothetical protein
MDINNLITNLMALLGLFLLAYACFFVYAIFRKRRSEHEQEFNLTFLQIRIPKDNEIETKVAETMFSSLAGLRKGFFSSLLHGEYRISFEIVGKSNGIGFYVVVPDEIAILVEKQINAAYPSAEIDIINPQEIWDRGEFTHIAEFKLKGPSYYPIKVHEDIKNDTISSITSTMTKLSDDEVVALQYVLQPSSDNWRLAGRSFINRVKAAASNPDKKTNIDTNFLEGIEKKTAHPGFYAKIRAVSIAKDKITAQAHVQNLMSAFEQFTDINYNRFTQRGVWSRKKLVDDFIYRRINVIDIAIPVVGTSIYSNVSVLNTVEMATVFHMPNKNIETPNIMWLISRRSAAPTSISSEGLFLGHSIFRGIKKRVCLLPEDRRRHLYIIGQTGTGKSVFMSSLAMQDIKAGNGLALIDPHGTDIDDILQLIPEERIDDVILFDAGDTERPLGINLLEAQTPEERHMLINAFIALLYKLYDPNHQGIMGPQLERQIRNVMLTAMYDPEATMIDVLRLLIDAKYVNKFLPLIEDPLVKRFWTDEMARTTENRKGEMIGYIASKFDKLVTDILMRNILGQPKSAFNFNDLMSQKKIY